MKDFLKNKFDYKVVLYFLLFCSTFFMKNINLSLANSGVFTIYGLDFFSMIFIVYFIFLLKKKSIKLLKYKDFMIFIIFIFYCIFLFGFRFFNGSFTQASVLVLKNIIVAVWIYFMFRFDFIDINKIMKAFIFFDIFMSIVTIPLSLVSSLGQFYMRDYIMQSTSIRTIYQIITFGILVIYHHKNESKTTKIALHLHLFSLFTVSIITGARLNAVLVPCLIGIFLLMEFFRSRKRALSYILNICISFLLLIVMSPIFTNINYGMHRSLLTSNLTKMYSQTQIYNSLKLLSNDLIICNEYIPCNTSTDFENLPTNNGGVVETENEVSAIQNDNGANESKEMSTNVRLEVYEMAIKDIMKNPIFGIGFKYYSVDYTLNGISRTSSISSHNFIIDYILAFGIIGVILFLIFTLIDGINSFITVLIKKLLPWFQIIFIGFSILIIFAIAFFQPLFINPVILFYMYFQFGYFNDYLKRLNKKVLS